MRTRSPERRATHPERRRGATVLLVLALASTGCITLSAHQTADTLPAGQWQVGVAADGLLFRDKPGAGLTPSGELVVSARRGLGERVDVGVAVSGIGAAASLKVKLLDGPWILSVAPAASVVRMPASGTTTEALYLFGHLPVLVGHRVTPWATVTFGPQAVAGSWTPATGGSTFGVLAGGLVNLDVHFGGRWHLVPELDVLHSVVGAVPVSGWVVQLGPNVVVDL